MAIHIWSDGQYKSVDLAQYGADGTLSGAYIWRDGAWRTLWEKASAVVAWVDDFTTPQLHPRWELVWGTYTPPGLGAGQDQSEVETHLPSDDCRLDIRGTAGAGDYWSASILDGPNWGQGREAGVAYELGWLSFYTDLDRFETDLIVSPTDTVTLTVAAGVATLLLNGTTLKSLPTGLADTKWLRLTAGGYSTGARITHVGYTPI